MRSLLLAGMISLAVAPALHAQELDPDRIGTQIDWGTVRVEVWPTRSLGMNLAVATSEQTRLRQAHAMDGGFEPDSVVNWINFADRVVHPAAPPSSPQSALLTPVLRGYLGDSIRFYRRAKGRKWDERLAVLVDIAGSHPDHFNVFVLPDQAALLLAGLEREALLSGFNADSAEAASRPAVGRVDVDAPPALLKPGPMHYPPQMGGVRGRVRLRFVVDTTGWVDASTVRVILADHPGFVEAAKTVVIGSQFKPGRSHGALVNVEVQQNVYFAP